MTDVLNAEVEIVERDDAILVRLCPHCLGQITVRDPAQAIRCTTCRLIVGPSRSLTAQDAASAGKKTGAGAGALAARARREGSGADNDPSRALRDIRGIAAGLGIPPDRLRMVDYQSAWIGDQRLTTLAEIIGIFETWKAARAAAGS